MILLDTDILSLLMKGHPRIINRIEQEAEVAITIVTRIEILQGRFASLLKAANAGELMLAQSWLIDNERFVQRFAIEMFDAAAANEFDLLLLNKKLKKIGRADLLIAAIALARRAVLITRNVRHFQQVPKLRSENWAD